MIIVIINNFLAGGVDTTALESLPRNALIQGLNKAIQQETNRISHSCPDKMVK
jgi:hypothetical protein